MSKVVKGIKKHFKRVVKLVKKVAPIILAAAAIYFTAGAALGLPGAAAGWGGAGGVAAKITSSLGSGVLGSTVTGAVTSAGYGAAIGGVMSAASGGSFSKGAKSGAIGGAIVGGALGAMQGLSAAGAGAEAGAGAGGAETFAMPETGALPGGEFIDAAGNTIPAFDGPYAPGVQASSAMVPPTAVGADAATATTAAAGSASVPAGGEVITEIDPSTIPSPKPPVAPKTSGGLLGEGGWLERNQEIAGGAVSGIGRGLMAGAQADGDMAFLRERQNLISENYRGTDPGAQYRDLAGSASRRDRYDPRSYGSWEYQYDAAQGRIIKVPVGG